MAKKLFPNEAAKVSTTKKATKNKPAVEKVKLSAKLKLKKPSMVDAALQILRAAKEPMTCKDLVEAMTTKGLWSSPKGKTPANTLYSAFLRLLQNKGKAAPICKADKGTFALNPSAIA
jgi:hypothetical protein